VDATAGSRFVEVHIKYIIFWDKKAVGETDHSCATNSGWHSLCWRVLCRWNGWQGVF